MATRILPHAFLWLCGCALAGSAFAAETSSPFRAFVAPETLRSDRVTLLWDKPESIVGHGDYEITCNDRSLGTTTRTNFTATQLEPEHDYRFTVQCRPGRGAAPTFKADVVVRTKPREPVLSVERFGAKGDGTTVNTPAIQRAIDACPANGVVLIPRGVFVSGALFLKSDMTLEIAAGGVLQGSASPADYEPFIRNRFEGWELETYASLLNAGKMDHAGPANVRHLRIRGQGRISGGGDRLGKAMIAAHGLRGRGRLICLMNCSGVEIQGLTIDEPPCWTIHYIYSEDITCHDLTINSSVRNGDGLDPDSSRNSYIFNCSFSTGDDCIAIKSGKNPEGNVVNRPTENVRITDCVFTRGHGISIGSEISGGIRNVLVQDCVAGALLYGMQIKATKDRGAFVEGVVVRDCDLQKITVLTALPYNNDGQAAPEPPYFRHFRFAHLDLTKAKAGEPVVVVNGFAAPGHRTKDVRFENIRLPARAIVKVDQGEDISFAGVTTVDGEQPRYEITSSERVTH